jgi:hypothetical protein
MPLLNPAEPRGAAAGKDQSRFLDGLVEGTRRAFTGHTLYADWVLEIPEPMLRQLVRDGLSRAKILFGCLIGFFAFNGFLAQKMSFVGLFLPGLILAMIYYYCWSAMIGQCVERELLYHRRHGKWRWER